MTMRTRLTDRDFRAQLAGYSLTTAEILYRLPEVIAAQTVCVAEGEKDCDNLAKLGFVATTNPLGAGKWRDEYSEILHGKDVIVFGDVGDADGEGEKHTVRVIESLTGEAKSIKHVTLPYGFHDVSDYIISLTPTKAVQVIAKLIEETAIVDQTFIEIAGQDQVRLPAPYVPPALDLLPTLLQDYVHAAAESLNVDVAFILLPLLSSLGAAVGHARSILLKHGFIQPPVIWTGIIGRSGSRKSPALEAGCIGKRRGIGALRRSRELQGDADGSIYQRVLADMKARDARDSVRQAAPLVAAADAIVIDTSTLDAIVVTGSPTSSGTKKLDASYSITSASLEEIRDVNPSSAADLPTQQFVGP